MIKTGKFKKLLKAGDTAGILKQMSELNGGGFAIYDVNDTLLWGEPASEFKVKTAVNYEGEDVAFVLSSQASDLVAAFIVLTLKQNDEKKTILNETLDRYKEITVLHNLGAKFMGDMVPAQIGDTAVFEILSTVAGDNVELLLLEDRTLKVLACANPEGTRPADVSTMEINSILSDVMHSGNAEIINDLKSDPRDTERYPHAHSMMCAPLNVQDKIFGILKVSSNSPYIYNSGELKIFTAIAAQAAFAIENSILHQGHIAEEKIKHNLERYVPSQLVDMIINSQGDISLEPTKKNITCLFSDIRNFTHSCEELPPEDIVNYLNEYFSSMVDIIFKFEGTINKFVGDMIVALFGAPADIDNRETLAVRSAIAMQRKLKVMPNEWIRDNFHTGIGINNGDVIVGNIGSSFHMDYTAIGDPVNVASRLQALAKGGQILVSAGIYEKTKDDFEYRKFEQVVALKGRTQPVEVYEVIYD